MTYRSYEDLDVWKEACQLAVDVYGALAGCVDRAIKDQMTRSAVSIASNIAEGAERNSRADYARFVHIAKGSSAELRTQLWIAQRVGLMQASTAEKLSADAKRVSSRLQRLAHALTRPTKSPNPVIT
jgi:four helix bundle protein